MYQPYPDQGRSPEPSGDPAPRSVVMAVRFMYAGAAASLIGIAINLTTAGSLRSQIARHSPTLTPSQVTNAEHVAIAASIVVGLIAAALWIWLASACRTGKNWARITATVLFAINTLGVIGSIAGGALPGSGASRGYGILVWLIGLVVIVLLWQRRSTDYFRRPTFR